jgi:hypothetical protein
MEPAMTRRYRTGSRWAFWRWSRHEHIVRLHLAQTPWFSVHLHWLLAPDPVLWLHDHPTDFFSIILWGGYTEIRNIRLPDEFAPLRELEVQRRWFNTFYANPNDRHRIIVVLPGTVTLSFHGRKRREWGYHTAAGWVGWREYRP